MVWAALDELPEAEFHAQLEALVAELPPDHPAGRFELGAAQDSTGHSDRAIPLYRGGAGRRSHRVAPPTSGDPDGQLAAQPRPGRGERAPVERRA